MKIDPSQLNKISDVYQNQLKKNRINQQTNINKEDEINISSKAREIKEIHHKLDTIDEIREEKVKNIKNALQNGSYNISPEEVAQKLLNGQE